jgi:hypothetical protein
MFIIWFFENPLGRSSLALAHEFGMNFDNEKMEEMKLPRKIKMHPLRRLLRVHIDSF